MNGNTFKIIFILVQALLIALKKIKILNISWLLILIPIITLFTIIFAIIVFIFIYIITY